MRGRKRSRKGCPECRRRKIKCDEQQPQCGHCRKANRNCRIQDSIFRQHELSIRFNDSVQGDQEDANNVTVTSEPASNAPLQNDEAVSAVNLPASGSRVNTSVYREETIDADDARNDSEPATIDGAGEGQPSPTTDDPHLEQDHLSVGFEVHLEGSPAQLEASAVDPLRNTQEELFLLRHYSECIAPWMDLLYRYEVFSREVLTLARDHPILRYAACAVAAKQLGQMRSPLSTIITGKTQQGIAAKLQRGPLGLMWYGAKYYEKAIQTLVKSITSEHPAQNYASPPTSLSQGNLMIRADGEDPIVRLLGTCILIQYEQISANRDAWSGHLFGFSKLLDLIDDGRLLHPDPMFEAVYPFTKDIMQVKAGFWNFVVNDLEESFVSHRRTRIDTENLALWRNMGLLIEDNGSLTTGASPNSLANTAEHARDKALSYTLIRYLCKLINYLAPSSHLETMLIQPRLAFMSLEDHFQAWFQTISPSFLVDGTFFTDRGSSEAAPDLFSRELWFSNDLCATTMMYYHMACMLLLIHRPSELLPGDAGIGGRTSFDLLRAFRDVEHKLQGHASEVISIVRGTPCDAVRLRAIQPLYVAGRCCTQTEDRNRLVGMLREIEDDLGIVTGYRVESLLQEWGVGRESLSLAR
ncbi:Transcription activator AMTR1 [Colletotrichum fructicola]|nr:Transcription activator AMTR1 [Colletotrichum fructicola]KAF5486434.1 Transcription activator AMTR1 [Colletotrichum fructicola]